MSKKVEYNGKTYKIEVVSYGYSSSQFCVNGERSSKTIDNRILQDIPSYSAVAKAAIIEYEDRHNAEKKFKEWDGKLN